MKKLLSTCSILLLLISPSFSQSIIIGGSKINGVGAITSDKLVTGDTFNAEVLARTALSNSLAAVAKSGSAADLTGLLSSNNVSYLFSGSSFSSTVKNVLDQTLYATSFGVKCDNSTNDTVNINNAISFAGSNGKILVLPSGTCLVDSISAVNNVSVRGQGQTKTILKRTANKTGNMFAVGSFSDFKDFTIDGSKDSQTAGSCGISGYKVENVKIEDVTVTNVLGMGDCFQDSINITHLRQTVSYTRRPSSLTNTTGSNGYNGSGFWTASYDQTSRFYVGGNSYIDSISMFNDLDGLEYGSDNITIRGGSYHDNGQFTDLTASDQANNVHANLLGGALGAAGIYAAYGGTSPINPSNTIIENVRSYNNSESGFDIIPGIGGNYTGNVAYNNGTAAFNINSGVGTTSGIAQRYSFSNNIAYRNGVTTNIALLNASPTIEYRAGFVLSGIHRYATFIGNVAFDDRGANSTQRYGMVVSKDFTALGTPSFDHLTFIGNQLDYNKIDDTNFDGTNTPTPASVTNMTYLNERFGRIARVTTDVLSMNPSGDEALGLFFPQPSHNYGTNGPYTGWGKIVSSPQPPNASILILGNSYADNTLTLQNQTTGSFGQNAIRFLEPNGFTGNPGCERGAMGFGNLRSGTSGSTGVGDGFSRQMFIEIGNICKPGDNYGTSFSVVNTHNTNTNPDGSTTTPSGAAQSNPALIPGYQAMGVKEDGTFFVNTPNGTGTPFRAMTVTPDGSTALGIPLGVSSGGTGNAGGAWNSWSPVLTQSGGSGVTLTSPACKYLTQGKTLNFHCTVLVSYSTASPTEVDITLPNGVTLRDAQAFASINQSAGFGLMGFSNGNGTFGIRATPSGPITNANNQYIVISGTAETL